jgi:hypothetical protein
MERDCDWCPVIPNAFKKDERAGPSVGALRLADIEAVCVIEETRSKGSGHDRVMNDRHESLAPLDESGCRHSAVKICTLEYPQPVSQFTIS